MPTATTPVFCFIALTIPHLRLAASSSHPHVRSIISVPTTTIMGAQLPAAAHSSAGRPSYQHDRHLIHHTSAVSLYAVADGHGSAKDGHKVSHQIVSTLPRLLETHKAFTPSPELPTRLRAAIASLDASAIAATSAARIYAGSTLCAVLRMGTTLVCANVGDSRAVVVPADGHPRQLTTDHVCTHPAEKARIEKAGGVVIGGLLNGYISMSRAIGDDDLKAHRNLTPFPFHSGKEFAKDMFTSDADVTHYKVRENDVATIIASDGVWGSLSNSDVATVIRAEIRKGQTAEEVARAVVKKAISKGSKDNVTAVVAFLRRETAVRMLVGEKRDRKNRKGSYPPKSAADKHKDMSTEDGSDTAASSDGDVASSADSVVKMRSLHRDIGSRKHRNAGKGHTPGTRRFKWGKRTYSTTK